MNTPLRGWPIIAGFVLCLLGGTPARAATLTLLRQRDYFQFSPSDPAPAAAESHRFEAQAESTGPQGITNVLVTPPGKLAIQLHPSQDNSGNFSYDDTLDSLPALDATYPAGVYFIALQAPGSNQIVAVALPSTAFPTAPKLLNYPAAQAVDAALDFTLQFDAGGMSGDFVHLEIKDPNTGDTVYGSADFGEPGALTGAATDFLVPTATLQPGRVYAVSLQRWLPYPGTAGGHSTVAGIGTATTSRLTTSEGATPIGTVSPNLVRTGYFDQTSEADPVAPATNGFGFRAEVDGPATRLLDGAALDLLDGRVRLLAQDTDSSTPYFYFEDTFATEAAMVARHPAGTYTLNLLALGSNQVVTFTLPAIALPSAPKLLNHAASQTIDPSLPFTLQLGLGGQATNFAAVDIKDALTGNSVFSSPDLGQSQALDGASDSLALAPWTLSPNRTYNVEIQRYVVLFGTAPGADTKIGFGAVTRTSLQTLSASMPAVITLSNPYHTGGGFNVTATLQILNANYELVRSSDYTNWFIVDSRFVTTTNQTFTDSNPNNSFFIYRVKKP
jgi:hypothetical protein